MMLSFCLLVLGTDQRLTPFNRVVLSQRMTLKLGIKQDSPQVGMASKLNAEHVVDFALIPVGAWPQRGEGVYFGFRLSHGNLEPKPKTIGHR